MDDRSIEILEQLKAEVWWPWDRRGGSEGGYNLRPKRPNRLDFAASWQYRDAESRYKDEMAAYAQAQNINRQRWLALIDELVELNPAPMTAIRELERIYRHGSHRENTKARETLLRYLLR